MGPLPNFLVALAITMVTAAVTSIAWPRLTSRPRPPVMQSVRDALVTTSVGERMEDALGVSDAADVQPIRVGELVSSVAGSMAGAVEKKVTEIVVTNAVGQIANQFGALSTQQKQEIQEKICPAQ